MAEQINKEDITLDYLKSELQKLKTISRATNIVTKNEHPPTNSVVAICTVSALIIRVGFKIEAQCV
jgi:hypothetical protein